MGGKGSGRPPSVNSILNKNRRPEQKTPIATDMFLPNHSGQLDAGTFKLTDGSVLFANNQKITEDNARLFWDVVDTRLVIKSDSAVLTGLEVDGSIGIGVTGGGGLNSQGAIISQQTIRATNSIFTTGAGADIYTEGASANLWLGNATEGDALFHAGADGNVKAVDMTLSGDLKTAHTTGSVIFSDGTKLTEDNSNLIWNTARTELEPNLIRITSDGSQAYPALKFNDMNTGFFKSGDSIRLSINNSTEMIIDSTSLDMQTKKIINVVDPTANQEAATKKYVDDSFPVTHASTTGRTTDDHHAQAHTIVSHSDTTGTGAELNELTDGSTTTLHEHAGDGYQSGCRVYLSANQSIPNNVNTLVEFDRESWDTQNEFDTSTHKFTADVAGKYLVSFFVNIDDINIGDIMYTYIYVNDAQAWVLWTYAVVNAQNMAMSSATVLDLAIGDTVSLLVKQQEGTAQTLVSGESFAHMVIQKVG